MAILIDTKGNVSKVADTSLENLQKMVGGYIEIVNTPDRKNLFVCNEEGKLQGLPINVAATSFAQKIGALPQSDCFVGNIVYMYSYEID